MVWLVSGEKHASSVCTISVSVKQANRLIRWEASSDYENEETLLSYEMFSSHVDVVAYFLHVSLRAKAGSLTLMFNSATVFDERFCLDCKSHGGTSVANLAYTVCTTCERK